MGPRRSLLALLVSLAVPFVAVLPARAEPLYAVTSGNLLLSFDSATPGACSSVAITGLQAGEVLLGIDFRPAAPFGRLYGLGSAGSLYQVNTVTGAATPVGAGGLPISTFIAYGTDFNPVRQRHGEGRDPALRLARRVGGVQQHVAAMTNVPAPDVAQPAPPASGSQAARASATIVARGSARPAI